LEGLLPKDNENVLPDWATEPDEAAPVPFAPEQMIRCEQCLRANPPTRVNCLYCGAILPRDEANAFLRQPTLRRLEKWEQGYNTILLQPVPELNEERLLKTADLLRLSSEDLNRIFAAALPLPVARAASLDEAKLVSDRLSRVGIRCTTMPDGGAQSEQGVTKVRSMDIDATGSRLYQTRESEPRWLAWEKVQLIVVGRVISKRVEVKEQKARRSEDNILDSHEFVTDETVVDIYASDEPSTFRIGAKNFDFSCLGAKKSLTVGENINQLIALFRDYATQAEFDDSFNSVRKLLETVWPSEQQVETSGWRRERPGKVTLGTATELSNQNQFSLYSQLRRFLQTQSKFGETFDGV
jgi:hypothetical protein